MPQSNPEHNLIDALIALKSQYEQALTEADTKATHLREQLSHVNALLLNQFIPTKTHLKSAVPALTLEEVDAQVERLALAPATTEAPVTANATPSPNAIPRKPKVVPDSSPATGKRRPRPLLPAYDGLTRLEAIAQILQTTPGQDVTADQISEALFGTLSAADHKAERKSLNTQLYKGQSLKLWQKGTAPGTFLANASAASKRAQPKTKVPTATTKASDQSPAITASKRKSLPLLPVYAELTKREAIAQVLTAAAGEVLHQDTIIQTLYGDLSLEDLKDERVRIKTALLTGVKDGKWQKAFEPSSYFLKTTGVNLKPQNSGRKPKAQTPNAEAVNGSAPIVLSTVETKLPTESTASAKKRNSLTVLPAFEGLSKLDAIATVLENNPGEVLHQDTIIQTLYGDLSLEDLKKERVRMDTCLRNGVKANKWKKASVAASYFRGDIATVAKSKRSGQTPKAPKPNSKSAVEALEAIPPVKATATKPKAAKPKPTATKAKASKKQTRSQRTEAELIKILQKADIQV